MRIPLSLSGLLRLLTATAVALSWSAIAALPATAAVTGWGVQTPSEGAVLERTAELVIYVDRTAPPEDESVEVSTRMLDASGAPVSDTVLNLKLFKRIPNDTGDQLLFGGTINPNELAWLAQPRAVPNGGYTLQYQVHVATGEVEESSGWTDHQLVFDAPPPPPGQPQVQVADAAAKRLEVAWKPSRVPDLAHYAVERRVDGGPWQIAQKVVDPEVTKITDTVASYGSYRYRVTAVRPAGRAPDEPTGSEAPEPPNPPDAGATEQPEPSEDPHDYRTAQSDPSATTELAAPSEPADRGNAGGEDVAGPGTTSGPGIQAPAPGVQAPQFDVPADANQTYEGPLDYGVEPTEVTERVPIEVARGGTSDDDGVLRVLRSVDQERVLPAVAGGLIFLLSAAHVVRYLNE